MNDNLITFSGWVGGPVELAHVRDGVPVASFRVGSTPRRLRDGRWEDGETVWYSVKAWRQLAENVAASLGTGEPVLVTGRMTAESWTAQDGTVATRHVVVAVAVGHDLSRGTSAFSRQQAQAFGESSAAAADATDAVDAGGGRGATEVAGGAGTIDGGAAEGVATGAAGEAQPGREPVPAA